MIKFEEMPPSAQKSYNMTNTIRKGAMFIGWGLYVLTLISAFFNKNNGLLDYLFGPLIVAGFISGTVHGAPKCKKIAKKSGILLFPFGLVFTIFVWFIFMCIGGIFLIADTISFFKKKPLIYQFEMHNFLESEKAQAEMQLKSYNNR